MNGSAVGPFRLLVTGLPTTATLALSLLAFGEKPLHVVVVRDGVPVPHARVLLRDAAAGAQVRRNVERVVRDDFDAWFDEHSLARRTDAGGRLHLDAAAERVWIRAEHAGLRALEFVGALAPRHVVLALGSDAPLSIETQTEHGFEAPHVSLTLQEWSASPSCGLLAEVWTGRSDGYGRADVPHFEYLLRRCTGRTEYGDRGLSLRAETSDGRQGFLDLTPTRAAKRRRFVVRLSRESETFLEEPPRIVARAELVDADGGELPMNVRVVTTNVPDVAFGRFHRVARRSHESVDDHLHFPIAAAPGSGARVEFESRAVDGGLLVAALPHDALPPGDAIHFGRIVLRPAPLLVGGVVDRGSAPSDARVLVRLFSSELPVTRLDRDAAWTCPPDPDDPKRFLWPRRTIVGRPAGTYHVDAPPGRWYVQAEVEGWWRSAPVRVDHDRIDFVTTDDCRLEPKGE